MVCVAVVDDEPTIVEIVDQLLVEQGWDVLNCRDGRVAAALIKQEQPDVILLEVWLRTVQSGWSVLYELQQDPRTSTIPTIVYSGALDQLQAKKEWLGERGIAVLAKPFDIDDFEHTVRAALARKSLTLPCVQLEAIAL
jgi:two-component system alkaline phosphatase synthesis response regulator PhoP